jgi:hypothetical protein
MPELIIAVVAFCGVLWLAIFIATLPKGVGIWFAIQTLHPSLRGDSHHGDYLGFVKERVRTATQKAKEEELLRWRAQGLSSSPAGASKNG